MNNKPVLPKIEEETRNENIDTIYAMKLISKLF